MCEGKAQGLEERNAELEAEVERLRLENELFRKEHKVAGGFATLLLAGPGLVKAFRKWFHVVKREGETPVEESADLAAAITRRLINVGIVGLFFASILPAGLLLWQTSLMRSQNEYFRDQNWFIQQQNLLVRKQNQYFREQNKVILDDSTRARRAQLIATIYDEDCSLREPGEKECPPRAHIRSRAEAALALVELDRGLGRKPSLAFANLHGADLGGAKLRGVNLRMANLRESILGGADLQRANLTKANLYNANLRTANLQQATLLRTDLQRAFLVGADLQMAHLEGASLGLAFLQEADLRDGVLVGADLQEASLGLADLRGADLRSSLIAHEQLTIAIIDKRTVLPGYLEYLENAEEKLLESSKRNLEELERRRAQSATADQPPPSRTHPPGSPSPTSSYHRPTVHP